MIVLKMLQPILGFIICIGMIIYIIDFMKRYGISVVRILLAILYICGAFICAVLIRFAPLL